VVVSFFVVLTLSLLQTKPSKPQEKGVLDINQEKKSKLYEQFKN